MAARSCRSSSAQLGDLVRRHLVGADEDALVAAPGRHDGQADAGVAAGGLDDGAAGLQAPVALRVVYEVAQGWAPLCGFLGVPVPEGPMPKVNSPAGVTGMRSAKGS